MYAVTVTFRLHPGRMEEFLKPMLTNARASLRDEPGCRRFDVLTDPGRPDEVFLYEIYDNAAAFDAHRATPHYAAFEPAVAGMVADKIVALYGEVRT
jgi:quinol monooxygenase YgiN